MLTNPRPVRLADELSPQRIREQAEQPLVVQVATVVERQFPLRVLFHTHGQIRRDMVPFHVHTQRAQMERGLVPYLLKLEGHIGQLAEEDCQDHDIHEHHEHSKQPLGHVARRPDLGAALELHHRPVRRRHVRVDGLCIRLQVLLDPAALGGPEGVPGAAAEVDPEEHAAKHAQQLDQQQTGQRVHRLQQQANQAHEFGEANEADHVQVPDPLVVLESRQPQKPIGGQGEEVEEEPRLGVVARDRPALHLERPVGEVARGEGHRYVHKPKAPPAPVPDQQDRHRPGVEDLEGHPEDVVADHHQTRHVPCDADHRMREEDGDLPTPHQDAPALALRLVPELGAARRLVGYPLQGVGLVAPAVS
mmetsp:Transcript_68008/g.208428  ORF Transcript_68008/g.208428 Transcript_68008/m.208428 type:complete len:362 (-) Transcript_68008:879-1964(-)